MAWFQMADLSKELDLLKLKYGVNDNTESNQKEKRQTFTIGEKVSDTGNESKDFYFELNIEDEKEVKSGSKMCKHKKQYSLRIDPRKTNDKVATEKIKNGHKKRYAKNKVTENEYQLMGFRDLIQPDIISLCTSNGINRYAVNSLLAMISMYAMSLFQWRVSFLSWLHVVSGFAGYLIILIIMYAKFLNGMEPIYYSYLSATILSLFAFVNLLLPKLITIEGLPSQIVYLASNMWFNCWIYFNAQSAGKLLLFKTVGPENSCFIDGVRSAFGAGMRILAFSTGFLFYATPVYFVLPIGIIQFLCLCVLLWRHRIYVDYT